jgi:hypothetical protein
MFASSNGQRRGTHGLLRSSCLFALVAALELCRAPNVAAADCPADSNLLRRYLPLYLRPGEHAVESIAATGLAAAVHLEWRPEASRSPFGLGASGIPSRNLRYCLLLLHSLEADGIGPAQRVCLIEPCGKKLWVRDIDVFQSPRVSDFGTTALASLIKKQDDSRDPSAAPADSGSIEFIDAGGTTLGRWTCTADSLTWSWRTGMGTLEFVPASDHLLFLGIPRPALPDPPNALRCLSSSGRVLWSHRLGASPCGDLAFSPDGSLVIAYGQWDRKADVRVFEAEGRQLCRFELEASRYLFPMLIDATNRFAYFASDSVMALDLQTGKAQSPPPEAPLELLSASKDRTTRARAQELLRRLRSEAVPRR